MPFAQRGKPEMGWNLLFFYVKTFYIESASVCSVSMYLVYCIANFNIFNNDA